MNLPVPNLTRPQPPSDTPFKTQLVMSTLQKTQTIHAQLKTIEVLYATFLNTLHQHPDASVYEQFASETYSKAKEALEQEAVRLDAMLLLLSNSVDGTSSESNDCLCPPYMKYTKLLEILSRFDYYSKKYSFPFTGETFKQAVNDNDIAFVFFLLQTMDKHELSQSVSSAFEIAIICNHVKIVQMLLEDGRADPTGTVKYDTGWTHPLVEITHFGTQIAMDAIRFASMEGHIEVVRLLLQDPRVDPSVSNNEAILNAVSNGHTEIVRLLLQDPRVDPTDDNNWAIRDASELGHTEVVRLLLQDPRVDPSENNNYAIKAARTNGHEEIVQLLSRK